MCHLQELLKENFIRVWLKRIVLNENTTIRDISCIVTVPIC